MAWNAPSHARSVAVVETLGLREEFAPLDVPERVDIRCGKSQSCSVSGRFCRGAGRTNAKGATKAPYSSSDRKIQGFDSWLAVYGDGSFLADGLGEVVER